MPTKFQALIRTALADAQLQSALDGNAERRVQALTLAFASLPEGRPAMRLRAHAMRARVIDNLESYLDEFIAHATANGITIHRAADAAQALEIVSRIAQNCGAKLVAKSKTMVGEEIRLNEHLEAEGLRAVETDLGEYIVQLRGEPPAHIITPAVHLTRSQVGRTFEEKIGAALHHRHPHPDRRGAASAAPDLPRCRYRRLRGQRRGSRERDALPGDQ